MDHQVKHKSTDSTMIYITIEKAMFKSTEDQYVSRVAKTVEEAQKLVDVSFEYICDFGPQGKLFSKRK